MIERFEGKHFVKTSYHQYLEHIFNVHCLEYKCPCIITYRPEGSSTDFVTVNGIFLFISLL